MRFTRLKKGEDLAKVVRRAYRSEVKGGLAEAERLVVAANPHLADPRNVKAGAVVILPDVEGTRALGETETGTQAVAAALESALAALGDLGKVTEAGIARQETEIAGTLELLKTREVQALAGREPEAKLRVTAIQKNNAERQKNLSALRSSQKSALAEFQADARSLLAFLGGGEQSKE
jgi:hypothetical protein